jgi:hypothetical protein
MMVLRPAMTMTMRKAASGVAGALEGRFRARGQICRSVAWFSVCGCGCPQEFNSRVSLLAVHVIALAHTVECRWELP